MSACTLLHPLCVLLLQEPLADALRDEELRKLSEPAGSFLLAPRP